MNSKTSRNGYGIYLCLVLSMLLGPRVLEAACTIDGVEQVNVTELTCDGTTTKCSGATIVGCDTIMCHNTSACVGTSISGARLVVCTAPMACANLTAMEGGILQCQPFSTNVTTTNVTTSVTSTEVVREATCAHLGDVDPLPDMVLCESVAACYDLDILGAPAGETAAPGLYGYPIGRSVPTKNQK